MICLPLSTIERSEEGSNSPHKKLQLLLIQRRDHPSIHKWALPGGFLNMDEDLIQGAYRELEEETGISSKDINLTHLMDFTYYIHDCYLEVYVGKLNKEFRVFGDENELIWADLKEDFFHINKYAGEGNIGHIIEHVEMSKDRLLR